MVRLSQNLRITGPRCVSALPQSGCPVLTSGIMKKTLALAALAILLAPTASWADSIASMKRSPGQDMTVEGGVITIYPDSFLFDDGSDTAVVDLKPYTTHGIKLRPQDYVQVSGHMQDNGTIKPLVIARANAEPVVFSTTNFEVPAIPSDEALHNSEKNLLPNIPLYSSTTAAAKAAAGAQAAAAAGANGTGGAANNRAIPSQAPNFSGGAGSGAGSTGNQAGATAAPQVSESSVLAKGVEEAQSMVNTMRGGGN